MRRVLGVLVGFVAVAFTYAIGAGGAAGSADRTLRVEARPGECVQAGFVTYGSLELRGAPTALSAAARHVDGSSLRERAYEPGRASVVDALDRGANVVASFRAENLDGKQWVVTEYQRSAPCGSEDDTMFTVPYNENGPTR